jgi:hypothetical protein
VLPRHRSGTSRCRFGSDFVSPLPNKRLKLPGGDRFKGIGVLCAWHASANAELSCAGGRVARSLSAVR